jgi:hypothetical protein
MVAMGTGSEQAVEGTPLLSGTDNNISSNDSNNGNILNKKETRKRVSFHGDISIDDNMNNAWKDTSTRSDADTGFPSTTTTPNNSLRSSTGSSSSSISPSTSSFRWNVLNHYKASDSQRERALSKEGVGAAAFLIRDAVLGETDSHDPACGVYDPYQHPEKRFFNNISIASRRLTSYRPLLHFMRAVAWTLVLLAFIEPPQWCRESETNTASSDSSISSTTTESESTLSGCPAYLAAEGIPADNSSDKPVSYYPNSGSLLVTASQSNTIEAVCLALISLFLLLRLGRDGMSLTRYLRVGQSRVNRVVQVTALIMLIVGLLTDYRPHHPVARLVLLATFLPGCQRDLKVLINMLPGIANVLALLTIVITFYAWFGAVMFVDMPEGSQHFSSLIEAMWTLVCDELIYALLWMYRRHLYCIVMCMLC